MHTKQSTRQNDNTVNNRPTVVQQVCGGGGGVTLILGGMGGGGRGEGGGGGGGEEKACHQKTKQKTKTKNPINTQTTTSATKKVAHLTYPYMAYLVCNKQKVLHWRTTYGPSRSLRSSSERPYLRLTVHRGTLLCCRWTINLQPTQKHFGADGL